MNSGKGCASAVRLGFKNSMFLLASTARTNLLAVGAFFFFGKRKSMKRPIIAPCALKDLFIMLVFIHQNGCKLTACTAELSVEFKKTCRKISQKES